MEEANAMQSLSNKYGDIGLSFNPFPLMPTPIRVKFVSGKDRKDKLKTIFEQITRVKKGMPVCVGIIGDYGEGKSHIMKHIEYRLSRDPETNPDENIAVYIHRPYDPREKCDLCYLCSLIIEYLNLSQREDFLSHLVQKLYATVAIQMLKAKEWKKITKINLGSRILGYIYPKPLENFRIALVSGLENDFRSIVNMEEEIDFYKLRHMVIERLKINFETRNPDRSNYIDMFFLEKLTELFFEDHRDETLKGISDQFNRNNKEARKFLKTVLNLAGYVGYRIFALLVDELDQIPEEDMKMLLGEITVFLEETGEKAPPPNLMVILSYTPKPSLLSPFYMRRMGLKIGLGTVSKEDTREMILDYLNEARTPSKVLAPFDNQRVIDIWQASQGRIGDILECCFWIIEEVTDRRLESVTEDVLREVLTRYQAKDLPALAPLDAVLIPLEPSKLDCERVLNFFESKQGAAERSKILENATRILCMALKNHPLDSTFITSVADRRRRLKIEGGRKKSREVDVYLTRQRINEPEKIIAIEVKAYKIRKKRCYVKLEDLEAPFELLERKMVDKVIILTTADLDPDVINKMKGFKNKAVRCQLDDGQLAQLIYSTDTNFFGKELTFDEAKQVAEKIGLLEHLIG